jgi:hypothetical protein
MHAICAVLDRTPATFSEATGQRARGKAAPRSADPSAARDPVIVSAIVGASHRGIVVDDRPLRIRMRALRRSRSDGAQVGDRTRP